MQQTQQVAPQGGSSIYRQREATKYKGVTKTSGTHSGVEKYDVQFVFCDGGTKKHPKIYGFTNQASAARAFDLLLLRRALEKARSIDPQVLGNEHALGNNFPLTEYQGEGFLTLMRRLSRDDLIYSLKQAAKRSLPMDASTLIKDLSEALEAANRDAQERLRAGDPRQSYEPGAKGAPSGANAADRKRRTAAGASGSNGSRKRRAGSDDLQLQLGEIGSLPLLAGMQDPALLASMHLLQMLPMPVALEKEGEDAPPDGIYFFLEICRSACATNPEMVCVLDLIRIWEALKVTGTNWMAGQYSLPATYYQSHIEELAACQDLRAALGLCHGLSKSGILRHYATMYSTSFANPNMLALVQQQGGSGNGLGLAMEEEALAAAAAASGYGGQIGGIDTTQQQQQQLQQQQQHQQVGNVAAAAVGLPSGHATDLLIAPGTEAGVGVGVGVGNNGTGINHTNVTNNNNNSNNVAMQTQMQMLFQMAAAGQAPPSSAAGEGPQGMDSGTTAAAAAAAAVIGTAMANGGTIEEYRSRTEQLNQLYYTLQGEMSAGIDAETAAHIQQQHQQQQQALAAVLTPDTIEGLPIDTVMPPQP